jgi:5-methylcytosine-specific restriction endonuclease McrA
VRAQVLATSTACWLCGHDGSDSVDHVIARALCIAAGRHDLLNDIANLRPAHQRPCPTCGQQCNRQRGTGTGKRQRPAKSRAW